MIDYMMFWLARTLVEFGIFVFIVCLVLAILWWVSK